MKVNHLPYWHPAFLLSTWFGAGLLRPAPGTWGTVAALPFAWVISAYFTPWFLLPASIAIFALGVWSSARYSKATDTHDASEIVIDEVAGIWLALAFAPVSLTAFALAFVLFRFFDITKPWPIGWADKTLPGGLGIMTDDMIAGAFAGIIVYLVNHYGWLPHVSF